MRSTSKKEVEAVSRLSGPDRYAHFVKRVADEQRVWGLWDNGWALLAETDETAVMPLWPAAEYAALHATDDWSNYTPKSVSLDELRNELLPGLEQSGLRIGVFPMHGSGIVVSVADLLSALDEECEKYA